MRPGQNNFKNRNRNRNRRHGTGNGGGGGSPNNRVLDSNGPDVKLRGTAQTIAEKYLQLARDATSSGDRVMGESYFQHADHYYRLWLAAQPPGQPIVFGRRPDDEVDEIETGDDDGGADAGPGDTPEGLDGSAMAEQPRGGDNQGSEDGEAPQNRNFRPRNFNDQQDGNRDRNRNRWPRRNERQAEPRDYPAGESQVDNIAPVQNAGDGAVAAERIDAVEGGERIERPVRSERNERRERFPRRERGEAAPQQEASGDWEAPSFLKRPMPIAGEEAAVEGQPPREERKPRGRRPRYGEEGVEANEPPASEE
jgi:Domain of unknown function (DUF4167)